MAEIRAAIAAAGRGSRSGLPYPKTLHPVDGRPILLRLVEAVSVVDRRPTIIVSPGGREPISECLARAGVTADLVIQQKPTGMGDAVLALRETEAAAASDLLLVWGDLPFLQPRTVSGLVEAHLADDNDFTFATRHVESAYTFVRRDGSGQVRELVETREEGLAPGPGERDIGLFVFRPALVLPLLEQRLSGWVGRSTREHGFLYIVGHLVERGFKVEGAPVATKYDLISLNRLSDLELLARPRGSL